MEMTVPTEAIPPRPAGAEQRVSCFIRAGQVAGRGEEAVSHARPADRMWLHSGFKTSFESPDVAGAETSPSRPFPQFSQALA
jgi:hypothetical protein